MAYGIQNLAITTPTLGTIRLGDVAVKNDQRIPVRSNHFKITANFKDSDKCWVLHPIHASVAEATKQKPEAITSIPVRMMFNEPTLNMRERYEAFDAGGRTVCAGNGKCARRRVEGKVVAVDCPGSDNCSFGIDARCDLFARLNVIIEGQDDELSSFILRTESVNAVKALRAKLNRIYALMGKRLIGIPMTLKLRQKATSKSYWTRFWYADLVLNQPALESVRLAKEYEALLAEAGIDQSEFEKEAQAGLNNSAFEEGSDEFDDIESFLLARGLGDEGDGGATGETISIPPEGEIETSSTQSEDQTQSGGLEGLRNFLEVADEAGALTINLTESARK